MARSKKTNPYSIKAPLEAHTRTIIEDKLKSLGYNMDESKPSICNIFRERAKYNYQDDLLKSKDPDFLVYQTNSSRILAVIEAKRPSVTLESAITQAIDRYAIPLDIPIIFVFNSNSFYACTKDRQPIKIDNIEISDFVNEATLINLIDNNFDIQSVPEGFSLSRADLLKKFKTANNLLRKAGLRDGYERFSVFADLMFLKLKNDFNDIGDAVVSTARANEIPSWNKLMQKTPKYIGKENFHIEDSEVKQYLDHIIKPQLSASYGDVFESSLNIKDESILIELIEEIDEINFSCVDSDVKGDAFEFFLRNVTNGNKDLGEYYTPRHIVKMIVKLINPKYGERIYDPCSGTGGFLLECFRYLKENSDTAILPGDGDELRNRKKNKLRYIREESIYGREITSTARIAKMNMILFGDGHTNIRQMDCLSEPVNGEYQVVISNIPYSQEVENGALYDFPSNIGDSVFMQHIWNAVAPGGRMAVIVPDTFLYADGEVEKIRKKIIDGSTRLIVISLPRGVFNPYTPTKTSVLVAYKKQNIHDELGDSYFYVIRNDGFELGARRRPLQGQSDCNKFLMAYNEDASQRLCEEPTSINFKYSDIVRNNYSLFPFMYMEHLPSKDSDLALLGDYIEERNIKFRLADYRKPSTECAIISITQNGAYIDEIYTAEEMDSLSQTYKQVFPGDFAYNPHRINVGSVAIIPNLHKNMFVSNIYPVFKMKDGVDLPNYYVLKLLKSNLYKEIINDYCVGGASADLKLLWLKKIKFKLPSEQEKERIVKLTDKLDTAYKKYLKAVSMIMK